MTNKHLLWTIACALCVLVVLAFVAQATIPTLLRTNTVTLKAKPWNNGYVHVWHTIVEAPGVPTPFTDVRDGTRCTRLDQQTHRLIGPPPPIYYYHVDCNGVVGYVEVDQVR
jgi:hypothetical protein